MGAKLGLKTIIERATKKHGGKYDYSLLREPIRVIDKGKIICPEHGVFSQTINDHLQGKGCLECAKITIGNKFRWTFEQFVKHGIKKHKGKFTYPPQEYIGCDEPIIVICPVHGELNTTPTKHLSHGCKACAMEALWNKSRLSIDEITKRGHRRHEGFYDYSLITQATNVNTVVDIVCPIHGTFPQRIDAHLGGQGCPDCAIVRRYECFVSSLSEMVQKANKVHDGFYTYPKQKYVNGKTKITIICPDHGPFPQTPNAHLKGHGCPQCGNGRRISKMCIEWLNSLGIPNDPEHREVKLPVGNGRKKADGFDPKTNTIYEYYGDYYHGNPKKYDQNKPSKLGDATYGDLYAATMAREKLIKGAGYNLITIWESDFKALFQRTV